MCPKYHIYFALFLLFNPAFLYATVGIAHRGNSMLGPENTIAAFLACRNRADIVEFDVQLSADNQLVVIHDSEVSRTTNGTGLVNESTLVELKELDAGFWYAPYFVGEMIPTMEEAVQIILPFATALIDRKSGSAANYVSELQRLNLTSDVIIQSSDWQFLSLVNSLDQEIELLVFGAD